MRGCGRGTARPRSWPSTRPTPVPLWTETWRFCTGSRRPDSGSPQSWATISKRAGSSSRTWARKTPRDNFDGRLIQSEDPLFKPLSPRCRCWLESKSTPCRPGIRPWTATECAGSWPASSSGMWSTIWRGGPRNGLTRGLTIWHRGGGPPGPDLPPRLPPQQPLLPAHRRGGDDRRPGRARGTRHL